MAVTGVNNYSNIYTNAYTGNIQKNNAKETTEKLEEKYPDITWCSIYIEKNTMKIDISEGINYR